MRDIFRERPKEPTAIEAKEHFVCDMSFRWGFSGLCNVILGFWEPSLLVQTLQHCDNDNIICSLVKCRHLDFLPPSKWIGGNYQFKKQWFLCLPKLRHRQCKFFYIIIVIAVVIVYILYGLMSDSKRFNFFVVS